MDTLAHPETTPMTPPITPPGSRTSFATDSDAGSPPRIDDSCLPPLQSRRVTALRMAPVASESPLAQAPRARSASWQPSATSAFGAFQPPAQSRVHTPTEPGWPDASPLPFAQVESLSPPPSCASDDVSLSSSMLQGRGARSAPADTEVPSPPLKLAKLASWPSWLLPEFPAADGPAQHAGDTVAALPPAAHPAGQPPAQRPFLPDSLFDLDFGSSSLQPRFQRAPLALQPRVRQEVPMDMSPEPDWRNDFFALPPSPVREALDALLFDTPEPELTTPDPEDDYRSPDNR